MIKRTTKFSLKELEDLSLEMIYRWQDESVNLKGEKKER